jgi:protein TonB
LISRKNPEYPAIARQSGAQGQVVVTATIGVDGKVKNVTVVSGHPLLRNAAVTAVKQWVYKPTMLNGKPVESDSRISLNFVPR